VFLTPDAAKLGTYSAVTLSPAEQKALLDGLSLHRVGEFHPPLAYGLDGATQCIRIWQDGRAKKDCLWGGIEPRYRVLPKAPTEMVAIWHRLVHFASPRATVWLPDRIDVTLSPYSNFGDEKTCGKSAPLTWPADWPRPADKRGQPVTFALPGSKLEELRRLDRARTPRGCVPPILIGGDTYAMRYSFRLPHEEAWEEQRQAP